MREILFRGKQTVYGTWVEGYLVKKANSLYEDMELSFILRQERGKFGMLDSNVTWIPVKPETVGQYTGLKDKNGKRIFEGDIVKMSDGKIGIVVYLNVCAGYGLKGHGDGCSLCVSSDDERLVIGNIHDNPELMEAQYD